MRPPGVCLALQIDVRSQQWRQWYGNKLMSLSHHSSPDQGLIPTSRPNFVALCGAVLLTALVAGCGSGATPDTQPPNLVLILADDLGYGDLSIQGHPLIRTPNIDRIAREGQRWTSFYASAPMCNPSRVALLTGRMPIRIHANGKNLWADIPDDEGHDGRNAQSARLRDGLYRQVGPEAGASTIRARTPTTKASTTFSGSSAATTRRSGKGSSEPTRTSRTPPVRTSPFRSTARRKRSKRLPTNQP